MIDNSPPDALIGVLLAIYVLCGVAGWIILMGKRDGVPVVNVRGYDIEIKEDGSVQELLRPQAEDLFR